MPRTRIRTLRTPIVLAAISVPLSIALLVGWMWVVVQNLSLTQQVTQNTLLLVLGGLFFVVIMGVLITFSVFLGREIQEVRRQDSFIDAVTHELKSPLASLRLCLETLARPALAEGQREELRQMMLDDVDRLSQFIDDVLHASRLSMDRTGVTLAPVSLKAFAETTVALALERQRAEGTPVRLEVPPELELLTDATALSVILRNLLDNAIKYSSDRPEVSVRVMDRGDWVQIRVSDHGIGMAKGELKRVFQRFYRAPNEKVRARKGTGLGLFVVSTLARDLGGKAWAESAGPGEGATFVVELPRGRRAEKHASRGAA